MSIAGKILAKTAGKSDAKRDANLMAPSDVDAIYDVNYKANTDIYNNMDIYFPKGTEGSLPTVVSVHGGGYVYGTKEIYKYYGMSIAQRGFTFVNFNYHLAPEAKFPTQLGEINDVMRYVVHHASELHIDLNNIFMVGDSAGAQMASQYAAMLFNKDYAMKFPFDIATGFTLRALGLNCGMYELKETNGLIKGLKKDYLGSNPEKMMGSNYMELLDVLGNITADYPPTYLITAYYDFLKENAKPMCDFLRSKGIDADWKCYGDESKKYMAHVCHVNMNLQEAKEMNDDEINFFRKYIV